jgi:glucose/arabinose dehydrogenase
MRVIIIAIAFLIGAGCGFAQSLQTSAGRVALTPMMTGLDEPWAIGFLPDGSYLITQRDGVLLNVKDGSARKVAGVPRVVASGQGGLLDVMIPRDFTQSREVFLSYSKRLSGGAGTAMAVGKLSSNGRKLTNVRDLFQMNQGSSGGRHFGSRIVEARDGTLFMTLGERGMRAAAQDLTLHHGSVIRINRDGSIPADNPFVSRPGARPEIYSFGHRNPQGAALDANGTLWTAEHGAKGGDEVNRIRKGANYGWPIISYGVHYSGAKIGEGTARVGLKQPAHYWDPSIAPSGLMIYSGKLWPKWRGNLFVGSLKFDYISRLAGSTLSEVEQLSGPETERVRDIVEAPDGSIWFISVGNGAIYRMTPM